MDSPQHSDTGSDGYNTPTQDFTERIADVTMLMIACNAGDVETFTDIMTSLEDVKNLEESTQREAVMTYSIFISPNGGRQNTIKTRLLKQLTQLLDYITT